MSDHWLVLARQQNQSLELHSTHPTKEGAEWCADDLSERTGRIYYVAKIYRKMMPVEEP